MFCRIFSEWVSAPVRAQLGAAMAVFLVALLMGCGGDPSSFIPPDGKYDVRILRDEWGVPHIFGKTDADAAYGLAYAHCEDDWSNIEDSALIARAQLASARGQEAAKFDYLVQLFQVREFVAEKYEKELSADVRAVLEAYADGINHFAALHPDKMPDISLPITGQDVVVGSTFKAPFFYDLQDDLQKLYGDERAVPISRKGVVASLLPKENPFSGAAPIGSNVWAVGRSRSADGAVRLAINSHMPWEGPVTFYEAHLHSEEGWDMVGGTFPGGPMIFLGHDFNKGWCHTISRPDLADIYVLELNPENENQYKYDGEWRDLERGTARIKVKLWGAISWTFKREMLWSVHGPAIRQPHGVYAIRFAGYGKVRHLEQWYRMNKARNLEEFRSAMDMVALSSLNTLYADRHGDLFYAYNGQFPVRPEGFDWKKYLPGNTSAALPEETYAFAKLPQLVNPDSDLLASCNSTPFHATVGAENPKPADFPVMMGIETHQTNRQKRALKLYGDDDSITREEFYAYKYDKTYAKDSGVVKAVKRVLDAEVPDEPLLQQGLEVLRGWDRGTDRKNRAAALAVLIGENHPDRSSWGKGPVDVLRGACKVLMKHHGRLDPIWEEMMRLRRGEVDLGLGGGPDCLRALDPALDEDGRFTGINGDCYFLMVEWDKEGRMRSEAIHQYGAATVDEDSPHYADQAPLFAAEKMRTTLLREEDIRTHLKKEYRPGDFDGPWYAQ